MLDRIWWFVTGMLVGMTITVRALGRRPRAEDMRTAAANTGADILDLAARAVRPR